MDKDAQGVREGEEPTDARGHDEVVLRYVAALQTRAAVPSRLQPDAEARRLAIEVDADAQEDGLEQVLAEGTPASTSYLSQLEPGFVESARGYGERHHVTYEGWLQTGVSPDVLVRAGIVPRQQGASDEA